MIPYMYHCHLLHHEDDGMMGSFLVYDSTLNIKTLNENSISIYPNPTSNEWNIQIEKEKFEYAYLYKVSGELLFKVDLNSENEINISSENLTSGVYFLKIGTLQSNFNLSLIKN